MGLRYRYRPRSDQRTGMLRDTYKAARMSAEEMLAADHSGVVVERVWEHPGGDATLNTYWTTHVAIRPEWRCRR